jgi:hypothetical protein
VWLFRGRPGQHAAKQKPLADVNAGAAFNDLTHIISSLPKSWHIRHKLFHGLFAPIRGFTSTSQEQFYPRGYSAIPATSLSSATEPDYSLCPGRPTWRMGIPISGTAARFHDQG